MRSERAPTDGSLRQPITAPGCEKSCEEPRGHALPRRALFGRCAELGGVRRDLDDEVGVQRGRDPVKERDGGDDSPGFETG